MFNDEMENDLAQHCINVVRVHHGLSPEKISNYLLNLSFVITLNAQS